MWPCEVLQTPGPAPVPWQMAFPADPWAGRLPGHRTKPQGVAVRCPKAPAPPKGVRALGSIHLWKVAPGLPWAWGGAGLSSLPVGLALGNLWATAFSHGLLTNEGGEGFWPRWGTGLTLLSLYKREHVGGEASPAHLGLFRAVSSAEASAGPGNWLVGGPVLPELAVYPLGAPSGPPPGSWCISLLCWQLVPRAAGTAASSQGLPHLD